MRKTRTNANKGHRRVADVGGSFHKPASAVMSPCPIHGNSSLLSIDFMHACTHTHTHTPSLSQCACDVDLYPSKFICLPAERSTYLANSIYLPNPTYRLCRYFPKYLSITICVYVCLSVYLSTYLEDISNYAATYPPIYRSILLSVYPPFYYLHTVYLSSYLPSSPSLNTLPTDTYLPILPAYPAYLPTDRQACRSVGRSLLLFACLPIYLSTHLSISPYN